MESWNGVAIVRSIDAVVCTMLVGQLIMVCEMNGGEIGWVGLMLGKEETRNACTVMTAAAVSAQDEFQTGLAAAEPQLCMNLQLARNSLALIAGWCCLGRVLPAVPFNLRSYQAGCE